MAGLIHTVGGTDNLVSFQSAARGPIESLKVHFEPVQEGEGDPSPDNVRPIHGWNSCQIYKTGKNIAQIAGYNAKNSSNADEHNDLFNAYGTTINTNSSEDSLIITQNQAPNTEVAYSYNNGYFAIMVKNLIYGNHYDVSFKITEIKENLLNCNLDKIQLLMPGGHGRFPTEIINDNILLFKNIYWDRYPVDPTNYSYNRSNFEIRNCGMSFTLSEFMVTPVGMNDGVFEPYCGERLPITFPITGKNKFNSLDVTNFGYLSYDSDTNTFVNTIDDTRSTLEIYCEGWANTTSDRIASFFSRYQVPVGHFTHTFTVTNPLFENMNYLRLKHNGSKKDFSLLVPLKLIVGQTYTLSMDITGADPTTVGGVSFSNIQIELGSTATEYEPYNSDNTIYGGYVDIAAGEVVAEYGILDLGSFTWSLYSNNTNRQAWHTWVNGLKPRYGSDEIANCCSTIFTPTTQAAVWNPYCLCTPNYAKSNLLIFFNPDQYNDGTEVQNAVNGVPLIYELLEPIHYPISHSQITALLGQNNFYSNANSTTEISYAIHDTASIRAAKKRMAAENDKHYRKVLWNQWAPVVNSTNYKAYNSDNITVSVEDDIIIQTWKKKIGEYYGSVNTLNSKTHIAGRLYYLSYEFCADFEGYIGGTVGGTSSFRSTLTEKNKWDRFSCLVRRGNSGNFTNSILYMGRFVNTTGIEIGCTCMLRNPIVIDITQMFGKGNEPKTKTEFEHLCAINNINLYSYHPKDSGTEQIWCIPHTTDDKYITVNWNQYCPTLKSDNWKPYNSDKVNVEFDNYIMTTTIIDSASNYNTAIVSYHNWIKDHKYYIKEEFNPSKNAAFAIVCNNDWAATKACPANIWTTIQCIATSGSSNSGNIWLAYYVGSDASIGDTCQIRNPIVIDLTQMFGAGNEPTTVAELRETCLKNNINLDEVQSYTTGSTIIWKK